MPGNFSTHFFQGLEKSARTFPRLGKISAKISNPWKNRRLGFPTLGKLCAALLLAPLARAGEVKLSAGVFHLAQLGAAKEEAAKGGKALAFVLSELKGKSAKAAAPNTNYAFDKLKGVGVPVYVDYVEDLKGLAERQPLVAKALTSSQAGKTIPRVAVFDPELKRVLAVVSTMPMGVMGDGVYEDACKQVQDYLKNPEKQVHLDAGKKARKAEGKGRRK